MVHTFNFDETYYLFDSESGALHICDALTSQVVKKINGEEYNLEGVSEQVIKEIEEEIESPSLRQSTHTYTHKIMNS